MRETKRGVYVLDGLYTFATVSVAAMTEGLRKPSLIQRKEVGIHIVDIRIVGTPTPHSDLMKRFPINDKIVVPCTVNSYSRPNVVWKRNGRLLASSQRIQVRKYKTRIFIQMYSKSV